MCIACFSTSDGRKIQTYTMSHAKCVDMVINSVTALLLQRIATKIPKSKVPFLNINKINQKELKNIPTFGCVY